MGMRFDKLEMHNFGPYRGDQNLVFGDSRPIVLVHGDNERGKTSLLNALRWVLYRHALDRFGNVMPLTKLVNIPARDAGDWTMSVKLGFELDGTTWTMERRVQPKLEGTTPRSDTDFEEKVFCYHGARLLRPDQAQTEINRILPEHTSRFFLFDGELLTKYEVLLSNQDNQATLIKESIEHILGVPALQNAAADLKINLTEASRRHQTLAAADKAATVFATRGRALDAEIATIESDIEGLRTILGGMIRLQQELDEALQAFAGIEADVERLTEIEGDIRRLKEERKQRQQDRRDKLKDAWRDLVYPIVRERLEAAQDERERQNAALIEVGRHSARLRNLEIFSAQGICPVCGSAQEEEGRGEREREIAQLRTIIAQSGVEEEQALRVGESIRRLRQVTPAGVLDTIRSLEEGVKRINVDLADRELKHDEIAHRLRGHDKSDLARNRLEHTQLIEDIGVLKAKISEKEQLVADKVAEATKIRAQIKTVSGPDLNRLNREVQLYEEMIALFKRAVENLRDELRKAVERDATQIFLQLTTNSDYTSLRINGNYGLTILLAGGREVPVRSAGAEQIVALSLLGALNRNAIRRGPIVMDTPFGRLDPKHRENILKFVPTMAKQITLLVHGGEVDRDRDLQHIAQLIDKEYEIRRVAQFHSALVRGQEEA